MSGFEHLLIGRVVGRHYRIEEVLGDGGFGVVFRAADLRHGRAERAVAVKVLKVPVRAPADEVARLRARFRREASYAARLPTHPGIVPIYDYGTDEALNRDYIVMELLRGEDLRARLSRPDPLPLPQALRILRDAARALCVGHQEGLVHRDVKPGNLFLAEPEDGGSEPEVRVLDFGIAKPLAHDPDHTATHLTLDGRAPLSARYAAPEQLAAGDATCATDVYALGVVGFEMLTRTRLFTDADQNRREAGLPVPLPSIRARAPEVPQEVEEVLFQALADEPARRFPDAGAFARALQQACGRRRIALDPADRSGRRATGEPARGGADDRTALVEERTAPGVEERRAEPVPPLPKRRLRPRLPALRRRTALAAVAAGVLLAGGGAVAGGLAGGADPVTEVRRPAAPRRAPAALARDANREGLRHFQRREYGEALAAFRRAGSLVPAEAEYRNNEGYALFRLGRNDEAVAVLEEVVERYPDRHVAYANLADVYLAQGDTAAAVAALERLLARDPPRPRARLAQQVLERIRPADEEEEVVVEPDPMLAMPAIAGAHPDLEIAADRGDHGDAEVDTFRSEHP
ncbi:MAG TPA: protein kinase [Longimicrobiaceae bacterium]|jgi:serine/threonine-protein kinase